MPHTNYTRIVGPTGQPRLYESVEYSRRGCPKAVPAMLEFVLFQEGVVGFASWVKIEFVDLCPDMQNVLLTNASKEEVPCYQGIHRN